MYQLLPFLILLVLVIIFLFYTLMFDTQKFINDEVEKPFDIKNYQGKFYQIYKQNAFFETDCQASTANYELSQDGTELNINNVCYSNTGMGEEYTSKEKNLKELRSIKGVAKTTNDPLIFNIEFEYGQKGVYHIFYTNYEFSIVGDLNSNYLSILSRKPYVSKEELIKLKNMASDYGFNVLQ